MDDWGCRSSLDRHLRQRVHARIAKSSRLCSCKVACVLRWDVPFPPPLPLGLAAIVIFAVVVVPCDLIPKVLALSAAYRLSAIGAFTLQASIPLLDRVGRVLENASTFVAGFVTPVHLRTRARLSDAELETL